MRAFKLMGLMIVAAIILMGLAGCQSGGDTIKVGIVAPLWPAPTFGISTRDGALLAIDEWNAKGGVLRKRLPPWWRTASARPIRPSTPPIS